MIDDVLYPDLGCVIVLDNPERHEGFEVGMLTDVGLVGSVAREDFGVVQCGKLKDFWNTVDNIRKLRRAAAILTSLADRLQTISK